jgi:hypothetical protein
LRVPLGSLGNIVIVEIIATTDGHECIERPQSETVDPPQLLKLLTSDATQGCTYHSSISQFSGHGPPDYSIWTLAQPSPQCA